MDTPTLPGLDAMKITTLYIIGNGFDISHDIKSRYSDFREWVEDSGDPFLVGQMDVYFSNRRDLWNDVETALGEYDENEIINYCNPEDEFDLDHPMRSAAALEDAPDYLFNPVIGNFMTKFQEWVDSISIKGVEPVYRLSDSDKYLSFNYIETLEDIYGIPESQVLHIHGYRKSSRTYVIGHSNRREEDSSYVEEDLDFVNETRAKIIGWMNDYVKPVDYIIRDNRAFFSSLSNIERVIVIGHSLNQVDYPYLIKVRDSIKSDAEWIFTYYDKDDVKAIGDFISELGISNYQKIPNSDLYIAD